MKPNKLEFLGRLERAKESVKIAQQEIDEAMRMIVSGAPVVRDNLDLSACVATALVNANQAMVDLDALGQIFKSL